jgi:N-acyl homoserine lactone hydrolase
MRTCKPFARRAFGLGVLSGCLLTWTALAQADPEVTLTRLDCGNEPAPMNVDGYSDTYAYKGLVLQVTYSCYLIKHGSDYMLWDTGNPVGSGAAAPKVSLVDLLSQVKVSPDQVRYVGISHYHPDHSGQANFFPKSTLLIGKGDWDELTATQPPPGVDPAVFATWRAPFAPWLAGGGKVEMLTGTDKNVFHDGTVVMLSTPGHTPGHHSLLVRLSEMGYVLLTGDAAHFRENYERNGVPRGNFNRADTLASLDRLKEIENNLHATVIIAHDARDIGKLPAFPAAAH